MLHHSFPLTFTFLTEGCNKQANFSALSPFIHVGHKNCSYKVIHESFFSPVFNFELDLFVNWNSFIVCKSVIKLLKTITIITVFMDIVVLWARPGTVVFYSFSSLFVTLPYFRSILCQFEGPTPPELNFESLKDWELLQTNCYYVTYWSLSMKVCPNWCWYFYVQIKIMHMGVHKWVSFILRCFTFPYVFKS